MSGWMSASAVRESFLDATSMFYSSDADVYTGFAVLFAMVSIAGFVLLTVGVSRAVKRADQRYEGWFRTLYPGTAAAPAPPRHCRRHRFRIPGARTQSGRESPSIPPMPLRGPSQPGR